MNDADSNRFQDLLGLVSGPVARSRWIAACAMCAACGGSDKPAVAVDSMQPEVSHVETIQHEPCKESGNRVESLDTNGDGKPDIKRVLQGNTEICRIVDLNGDGKTDMYEYYEAGGTIRRREFCYDDTGDVNAVEHYEHGKLVRREFDAAGRHRIDTWDAFDPNLPLDPKTGRPAHPLHRERDTSGDGKVDQWWTWNGDKVTISVDRIGNGKPDPATAIVLGPDNSIQTPPPDPAPAATSTTPAATTQAADGGQP